MSVIPDNWAKSFMGETTQIIGGGTPHSKDPTNFTIEGGIPWVTPADLSGYKKIYITRGARNLTVKGLQSSSARMLPTGSVLFSSRAPIGYVAIAANEITTNQGFKSFVLPKELDSRFIYYYLRFITPIAKQMATGTTFKELSGAKAAQLPLLIAPFNEQQRIADKLNIVLARVDACCEHLDRVPEILKRFRQAVLSAAVMGKLITKDQINQHWKKVDIQSVAVVGTGSTPLRSNPQFYSKYGTPWITSASTSNAYIYEAQEFVTEQAISAHRLKLYPVGALIVAMYGEGKTRGQVSELAIEATINQACAAIIVDETVAEKAYVKFALQANYLEMRKLAEGGNQPNLNLSKIKEFKFLLPPREEQKEIVFHVEKLLAFADRIETHYQTASQTIANLTPALLAKAFRGELVPQDPNDEPAPVLLNRIRVERESREKETGQRRKPARKKKGSKVEGMMRKLSEIAPTHLSDILKENGSMLPEKLWAVSELEIEDFYDQLKNEEEKGLLNEKRNPLDDQIVMLEAL